MGEDLARTRDRGELRAEPEQLDPDRAALSSCGPGRTAGGAGRRGPGGAALQSARPVRLLHIQGGSQWRARTGQGGVASASPIPGAVAEGVSLEADSGSPRRAGRAAPRGGPQSFLPNFRCLLPPPARAAAVVWGGGGGGGGCGQRAGRRARGDRRRGSGGGQWAQAPRCPPLRWRWGARAGCRGGAGTAAAK